jgi:hypothetical protein
MESTKSTSRYILTALAMILVITAFVLVGLNAMNLEQKFSLSLDAMKRNASQAQEEYNKGYAAAQAKYKNLCPMIGRDSDTIGGKILSVSADKITITQDTFDTDETFDGIPDTRTAIVTAATKIQLQSPKPTEQLSQEMSDFKPASGNPPPSPFTISDIKLSDLKEGDRVSIKSDQEIRLVSEFKALKVTVIR